MSFMQLRSLTTQLTRSSSTAVKAPTPVIAAPQRISQRNAMRVGGLTLYTTAADSTQAKLEEELLNTGKKTGKSAADWMNDVEHMKATPEDMARFYVEDLDKLVARLKSDDKGGMQIPWTEDMRDKIQVNQILDMGRHTRVTPQGRVFSYSALVILGTGKGTAGVGYGKSDKPMDAVTKAQQDAQKRMFTLPMWHSTLVKPIELNYRGVKLHLINRFPGYGVSGHPILKLVAQAFGLEDVAIKTYNSINPRKLVIAMFNCIVKHSEHHPASQAKLTGRKFVTRENYWKPEPQPPKPTIAPGWTTVSRPTKSEVDETYKRISSFGPTSLNVLMRDLGMEEPEDFDDDLDAPKTAKGGKKE